MFRTLLTLIFSGLVASNALIAQAAIAKENDRPDNNSDQRMQHKEAEAKDISFICSTPLPATIKRGCQVEPNLWRGSRPTPNQLKELEQAGVKTIVNLEAEHNDISNFRKFIAAPDSSFPIQSTAPIKPTLRYFHIRSSEVFPLATKSLMDRQVARFIAIMQTQPSPIYVHCRSGQNRTGVMVGAYQLFTGAPMQEVLAQMQSFKGIWRYIDTAYLKTFTPNKMAHIQILIDQEKRKLKPSAMIQCQQTCSIYQGKDLENIVFEQPVIKALK